ncbi:hydantoinase/oxoprolinase family protein [Miniphocaeibacter halophilus]|uniref:Hydantoinase/oxoprolinase family protein n=1 Tax=Miniphocaeibacter halophilus TaxID=2931922 RepID=A0AC61MR74_9FIRM|nr:hydantoinase/oxoprolinase family protein [Miniphocaeibacter halophilus]QQK08077.1 hydantoinase/oxoprolinase family protein [Miniphocaeibacter halophilus]
MSNRKIRVGIDVGGTHTKAVAIDDSTYEIVGIGSVKTTHEDELGVSAGVVESFKKCLTENGISPDEVTFIAHSTTQATNALLEGDVAKTGIIAMGQGVVSGFLSKIQSNIKDIQLDESGKRKIKTAHRYINLKEINSVKINETIDELLQENCKVLVATKTFGVDNIDEELEVKKLGAKRGIEVTAASDISKLYGLTRRTRTAVINASILPKMFETADSTESAVRKAGIKAPLMIMRGDGGVMDIEEMRKRPVLTMLSGPAASTVGALMYLRVSNGIFFEVGGTSTDIGVIKNGRPMVDYAVVGGQNTLINSLDVHVSGVAGGSMVRASKNKIIKVGPRSAHIANLPYATYSDPEKLKNPEVVRIEPLKDDPSDYIAIECDNGFRVAVTVTDAAIVLGIVKEGDFSFGNKESSLIAVGALAKELNMSVEDCAKAILDDAADTCIAVIEELATKYKIEREQITLVGGGGGALTLLPFTANKMGLPYQIADNAEVISSIGVALAMVRDVVERVIPDPTPDDLADIRREATDMAIKSGATAESVEIQIEIDSQTSKVRAIATGSTEIQTQDLSKSIEDEEAKQIAADSMQVDASKVEILAKNSHFYVVGYEKQKTTEIRVVDKKGFVKIQRSDGDAVATTAAGVRALTDKLWEEMSVYKSDIKLSPDFYMCIGAKVIDYEGMASLEQMHMVMDSELITRPSNEEIILISARNDL